HRRIHRPGAAVRARHGIGPDRRRWMGLPGLLFTQHTVRLLRQAFERFGLGRTLAFGLDRHGWGGQAWLGLSEMQHDEEPYDRQQSELIVKKMREVVYLCAADNSSGPKIRENASISPHFGGGNAMVSPLFYSQLALLALVWLCVMLVLYLYLAA